MLFRKGLVEGYRKDMSTPFVGFLDRRLEMCYKIGPLILARYERRLNFIVVGRVRSLCVA